MEIIETLFLVLVVTAIFFAILAACAVLELAAEGTCTAFRWLRLRWWQRRLGIRPVRVPGMTRRAV